MNDSEIKDGKIIIKEPGLGCPAIILSVVIWIVALVWLLNIACK